MSDHASKPKPRRSPNRAPTRRGSLLAVLGPGVLVAATGVGAGDLAGAGLAGSNVGLLICWAAVVGAAAKYVLTENLARHQLGSGATVIQSAVTRLGWPLVVPFAVYFLLWSYYVGGALLKANAAVIGALLATLFGDGVHDWLRSDVTLMAAASAAAAVLASRGGFRLFERVMAGCIAVMVLVVVVAAVLSKPPLGELAAGLLIPRVPLGDADQLRWTIALIGGVGGTLTILCYAYWMREAGRTAPNQLRACRLDLGLGYAMTALFAVSMVVIAAPLDPEGRGSRFVVNLADALHAAFAADYSPVLADTMRLAFLLGAFGAVFSSLLGVWQAVPYVAADLWNMRRSVGRPAHHPAPPSTRSTPYRLYLVALAVVPLASVRVEFAAVQQLYGIVGALFVPGLALVLLLLNNRADLLAREHRNGWASNTVLAAALAVAALAAGFAIVV